MAESRCMTEEDCYRECEHPTDSNCEYCIYDSWSGCWCDTDSCCLAGCKDGCTEIGGNTHCNEDFQGSDNSNLNIIRPKK